MDADRLPGEPMLWYERYVKWREMVKPRNMVALANEWRDSVGKKRLGYAPGSWYRAQYRWKWQERAEAWDVEQLAREGEVWAARRKQSLEQRWSLGQKALDRAGLLLDRMDRFITRSDVVQPGDTPGETLRIITLEMKGGPTQISHLLKTGADLQKEAVGEPLRVALTDPTGEEAWSTLDTDTIIGLVADIAKSKSAAGGGEGGAEEPGGDGAAGLHEGDVS